MVLLLFWFYLLETVFSTFVLLECTNKIRGMKVLQWLHHQDRKFLHNPCIWFHLFEYQSKNHYLHDYQQKGYEIEQNPRIPRNNLSFYLLLFQLMLYMPNHPHLLVVKCEKNYQFLLSNNPCLIFHKNYQGKYMLL